MFYATTISNFVSSCYLMVVGINCMKALFMHFSKCIEMTILVLECLRGSLKVYSTQNQIHLKGLDLQSWPGYCAYCSCDKCYFYCLAYKKLSLFSVQLNNLKFKYLRLSEFSRRPLIISLFVPSAKDITVILVSSSD